MRSFLIYIINFVIFFCEATILRVNQDLSEDVPSEGKYKSLVRLLTSPSLIDGSTVYLKERTFHPIEGIFNLTISLTITTEITSTNPGSDFEEESKNYAEIQIFKGGLQSISQPGEKKSLNISKVKLNQKGLSSNPMASIIRIPDTSSLALKVRKKKQIKICDRK